jgi:AraC family transcriptional regulator of adaptative response / DNA-3-methyladenine glycosylase II
MDTQEKLRLYKSILSRDPRNDGRFYVGVKTTGIYCRPICPAKPKIENVEFFRSKAEAEKAGFRPCLRCKPDLSPLSQRWKGTAAVVGRALNLVERGDQGGEDIALIAERLGMTDRHLRRLFQEHVGASPIEVAISRRLHLARQLLTQSDLSVLDVALASGFHSLRRFNDAFVKTYQKSPREFRKEAGEERVKAEGLRIELPYSPPYDWSNLLAFFKRHEAFGIEWVEGDVYHRHFRSDRGHNYFQLRHLPKEHRLELEIKVAALEDLRPAIEWIRGQFDLSHNPHHIEMSEDEPEAWMEMRSDLRSVRVPGAFNSFEVAVSVILSQLVSTERARENLKKLILRFGDVVDSPLHPALTHYFPSPAVLKGADYSGLGFTRARSEAIRELSRQVDEGEIVLSQSSDLSATRQQLLAIKGIGPWTVEVIALRCLCDTNAFPAKDLIVARAIEKFGLAPDFLEPWRAYLALAIWKSQAHLLTKKGRKSDG